MILLKKIGCIFYRFIFRIKYKHIKLAEGTKVLPGTEFGGYNAIGKNSTFFGKIGHDSYVGSDSFIYADIGKYTSIGDRVRCVFASHPISEFVSTSPVFYSTRKQNGRSYVDKQLYDEVILQKGKKVPVIIGNDVWIGSDVTIVGKVVIHDGAILATGSVITKDVMPYSVVGGVPAKEIKKRFDEDKIRQLLSIKWWDKDEEWLMNNAELFENIDVFLESQKYSENTLDNKDEASPIAFVL